jgi:toxin YoeB
VKIIFSSQAWDDYLYWQKTDRSVLKRINSLIEDIRRSPYKGKGKPEPLRYALSGWWSRRISEEHRLVYRMDEGALLLAQLRYHY